MRNHHHSFDRYYIGKIYSGDSAKMCGLLRKHELNKVMFIKAVQDKNSSA